MRLGPRVWAKRFDWFGKRFFGPKMRGPKIRDGESWGYLYAGSAYALDKTPQ